MFKPTERIINAFVDRLVSDYKTVFVSGPEGHLDTIVRVARRSLNRIARSDALYHDLDHTLQVTMVGERLEGFR